MNRVSRRQFLKVAGIAVATFSAAAAPIERATAQDKLSPDDPTAVSLKYVEDAASIDAATVANFKAGSNCANCMLYQNAAAADGYAPCGAFAGKRVKASGWCAAWVARP